MNKLKISICIILLLSSCSTTPLQYSKNRNGKCLPSPRLQVMQILNEGILGHLCPVDFPSYYDNGFDACIAKGDLIYMAVKAKNNDYVDEQKVTLSDDKCFAADGVYSYFTKNDMQKRVRKIKIIDAEIADQPIKNQ